jgi:hypothetical protein
MVTDGVDKAKIKISCAKGNASVGIGSGATRNVARRTMGPPDTRREGPGAIRNAATGTSHQKRGEGRTHEERKMRTRKR